MSAVIVLRDLFEVDWIANKKAALFASYIFSSSLKCKLIFCCFIFVCFGPERTIVDVLFQRLTFWKMIGYTVYVQPNGDQAPQELTLHLQPEEGVIVSAPLSVKKQKKNKLKKAQQVEIAMTTQPMLNLANREEKGRPLTNSMEKATAEDRKLKSRKPEIKTGPEIGKHRDTAKSKETSSGLQEKRSRTRYACPFHRQQHKK